MLPATVSAMATSKLWKSEQPATEKSSLSAAYRCAGRKAASALLIVLACMISTPSTAWADVPMFVVVSALKLNALPFLFIVVLIEAAALCWAYSFDWKNSILTSVFANAFSMAVGFLAYPMLGGVLYVALTPFVVQTFGGSLSVEIIVTFLVVSVFDTLIELPFIATIRKVRISFRSAFVFLAANVVGMAVLAAALADYEEMSQPPIPDEVVSHIERTYEPEIAFMTQIFAELGQVYANSDKIYGSDWVAKIEDEARNYRFRWLTVSKQYQYSLYRDEERLHSTSQRRDTTAGQYQRDNVQVWRTMSQNGVWFYVYEIRTSWSNQEPRVRAWFDPP